MSIEPDESMSKRLKASLSSCEGGDVGKRWNTA